MMLNFQAARRSQALVAEGAESKATAEPPKAPAQPSTPAPGKAMRQTAATFAGTRAELPRGVSLSNPVQLRDRLTSIPGAAALPLRTAQLDPEMRSTMMVMELMQYMQENLAEQPGPHAPALLGELAEAVRTVVLHMPDAQWGEAFSALVQIAGHDQLAEDQLVPVFRAMVRGPQELGHLRMVAAVTSMCGLFKDNVLPAHWYPAMMRAAQAAWEAERTVGVRKGMLWLLEASVVGLPQEDPRRIVQDKTMLLAAVQTCADAPSPPVGLVAWMQRMMVREPGPRIMARVFEAVAASPGLSPAQLDNVTCILAAGVVARLEPTPAQLVHRLRPVLAWALQQPPAHRDGALDGLVTGISLHLASTRQGAAHLQAALDLLGQMHEAFVAAGATDAAVRFIDRVIMPPDRTMADGQDPCAVAAPLMPADDKKHETTHDARHTSKASGQRKAKAGSKPLAPSLPLPETKATGEPPAQAVADSDAGAPPLPRPTPEGALAGLRWLLAARSGDAAPPDAQLLAIGMALASVPEGSELPTQTLQVLVDGLLDADIPTRQAGLLLQGLAGGAGGPDMGDAAFAVFVQSLGLRSEPVAARLSCHVFAAIGATGAAGRALARPLSLRIVETLMTLPQPLRDRLGQPVGEATLDSGLLLGVNLADGPLPAVRGSGLSRDAQRQLLLEAYRVPRLLDEALIADEAQDCALLAKDDPDFALEAAQALLAQGGQAVSLESMRVLRAGLLVQVLGPQGNGHEGMPLATGLDRIGALYETFARAHGEPIPAATQAFLAQETGLLRGGPHADVLEPLAARLDGIR